MRRWLGFFVFIAHSCLLFAQQAPFVHFDGPNAPQRAGYLFEDSNGGLWVGASEGESALRYFDGSRFITPVDHFPNFLISGIQEDSEGGIWLATTGGLFRLRHRQLVKISNDQILGLTKVTRDVFLGVEPDKLDQSRAKLVRIAHLQGQWSIDMVAEVLPWNRFRLDAAGEILYSCSGGICGFQAEDFERWRNGEVLPVRLLRREVPNVNGIAEIVKDRAGCLWTRSQTQAAYQCPDDKDPVVLPIEVASVGSPRISELGDGEMLITSFNELAIGRPGHFMVIKGSSGYPGTGDHLVTRDGSIWLSSGKGLFVFSPHVRTEFWTVRDGLDGGVWSILPLLGEVFAVAADSVVALDSDRKRWHQIAAVASAISISAGPDQTLLVSSLSDGLCQMTTTGHVLRRSDRTRIMRAVETSAGEIWTVGQTISKAVLRGDRIDLLGAVPSAHGNGNDIAFDSRGGLWACYATIPFHLSDSGWHPLALRKPPSGCISLAFDHEGDLWFGTPLMLARNPLSAEPSVLTVPLSDGSFSKFSNFLGTDHRGRLWRGNSNGVYVSEPDQARQGQWLKLVSADINEGSFASDADGSVWFANDDAVTHLWPPDDLVHPTYSPSAFVSGFSWSRGEFRTAEAVDEIESGADVTAHFGSLQMDRRSAMNFRYRVMPQQSEWALGTNVDVGLGKLDWGESRLEVQARLLTGPWSSTYSKTLHVLRPLWLSSPALLTFVFIGGATAVGGYQFRRQRQRRAKTSLPELSAWRLAVVSSDLRSFSGKLLDNRFEVVRLVARGGFATVWEGHDREQGNRQCAIKIFRNELIDKSWMDKRFHHEVLALSQIHHPNVVPIYGHGKAPGGAPYLVMEFVNGETLREVLRRSRLTHAQTASYLRQTASALAEIHSHGVCHRDVKPENLMIRANGGLVLIDFSIAIVQDPDETIHGLSRAAGTIHYMAPEQAIGYADESTDIYSLAKLLIEMLAGERLSTLLPNASIDLPKQVRGLLSGLNAGLSAASIDLVATALEFDPSRRPKDAQAFGDQISRELDVKSVGID